MSLPPEHTAMLCTGALYGTYEAFRYKVSFQSSAAMLQTCKIVSPVAKACALATTQEHPLTGCFLLQVPGIYKIRYIGQTTLSSAAVSSLHDWSCVTLTASNCCCKRPYCYCQ